MADDYTAIFPAPDGGSLAVDRIANRMVMEPDSASVNGEGDFTVTFRCNTKSVAGPAFMRTLMGRRVCVTVEVIDHD